MSVHAGAALLILDLISDYRYPGGAALLPAALQATRRIAVLKARLGKQGIPTIYVNDTRGRWESDSAAFVRRCLQGSATAAKIVERLLPQPGDYFVFKPRHSAFFATPLQELLSRIGADTLILTGTTSHQCVLFTAIDAHVRRLEVIVPRDCIVAPSAAHTRHALFILQQSVGAKTLQSRHVRVPRERAQNRRI